MNIKEKEKLVEIAKLLNLEEENINLSKIEEAVRIQVKVNKDLISNVEKEKKLIKRIEEEFQKNLKLNMKLLEIEEIEENFEVLNLDKKYDIKKYLKNHHEDLINNTYNNYLNYIYFNTEKNTNVTKNTKINNIVKIVENNIDEFFDILTEDMIIEMKKLASNEGPFKAPFIYENKNKENALRFLCNLDFLQLREISRNNDKQSENKKVKEDELYNIHITNTVRDKILTYNSKEHKNRYLATQELIKVMLGVINTYGMIRLEEAAQIISKVIKMNYIKVLKKIEIIANIQIYDISYNYEKKILIKWDKNYEIEEIDYTNNKNVYDLKFYKQIATNEYIFLSKEYKKFKTYINGKYKLKSGDKPILEIIKNHIVNYELFGEEAIVELKTEIEEIFKCNEFVSTYLVKLIDDIRKIYPNWDKQGVIKW